MSVQIGALVERDQALHRGTIGRRRRRRHHGDRAAPGRPGRAQARPSRRRSRPRASAIVPPASSGAKRSATNFFWNVAAGIAECRAGASEHRGAVAVRPAAQQGLRDHATHRMADEHGLAQPVLHDRRFDVDRESLESHLRDRRTPAVARQIERNRLEAGRRERGDLRRPHARRAADAVQEHDGALATAMAGTGCPAALHARSLLDGCRLRATRSDVRLGPADGVDQGKDVAMMRRLPAFRAGHALDRLPGNVAGGAANPAGSIAYSRVRS